MLAFLVALVVLLASVGSLMYATRHATTGHVTNAADNARTNNDAKSVAGLVVATAGRVAGTSGCDWLPTTTTGLPAACVPTTTCSGWACYPLADQVGTGGRLGLVETGASDGSYVSFKKLENLRMAPFAADPADGYVNYEEAASALGVTGGHGFHLRGAPTLPKIQEILKTGHRDPNLRVTYIGNIDASKAKHSTTHTTVTAATLTVATPTCALSPLTTGTTPGDYRLSAVVTNDGATTTQFNALVEYTLGTVAARSQNTQTGLVAPGASATLSIDVPALAGGSCAVGSDLHFHVADTGTSTADKDTHLATAVTGATAATQDLWLDTSKPYYQNPTGALSGCSDPVVLGYNGLGLPKNDYVHLDVANATGTIVHSSSGVGEEKVPQSDTQRKFTSFCLAAGDYTATVYYCGGSACTASATKVRTTERVLVTTGSVAPYSTTTTDTTTDATYTYTPTTASSLEVGFLTRLVDNFCPSYFDSTTGTPLSPADWNQDGRIDAADTWTARCSGFSGSRTPSQPGDVFPDVKDAMNNDLAARLIDSSGNPRYDITRVLVVGSGVDQTAMTSSAAKDAVRDWVLGGGMLIVFGSSEQNVNWLEPIFHAAIRSSSGGISVPDAGHPLLHVSDDLDYIAYDNAGRVWNFNGQTAQEAAQLFTNVVVQGQDPVTTVGNPGAFGSGSLVLTTWQPWDLYNASRTDPVAEQQQGLMFTNNVLMQGYQDLFLDYGPQLPQGANVVPDVRHTQVVDPEFAAPIDLTIVVYAW